MPGDQLSREEHMQDFDRREEIRLEAKFRARKERIEDEWVETPATKIVGVGETVMVFIDVVDRDELCKLLGVTPGHLLAAFSVTEMTVLVRRPRPATTGEGGR